MRHRTIGFGAYETHFVEYGDPGRDVVVIMHGYTGHAQMHHHLAAALGRNYRVICPDALGRGFSSWLPADRRPYTLELLSNQIENLLDAEQIDRVRWLGSSMGGAIGLTLAGGPLQDRISHLALNDVGPEIPRVTGDMSKSFEERRDSPVFSTFSEISGCVRRSMDLIHKMPVEDEWWDAYCGPLFRRGPKGDFLPHYDPAIMEDFFDSVKTLDLWDAYRALNCRLMLIRGGASEALPAPVYERMQAVRQPDVTLVKPDVGHAPTLTADDEIEAVENFFSMEAN